MKTNISTIIQALETIKAKHGDIHVRIMGEPIAGVSVRKNIVWFADKKEERFEANFVGRAFDGILEELEGVYNKLEPIKTVKELQEKL